MKILVTGSEGTLGLKLVEELKARGHEVWGCDLRHGESNSIRADVSEARQVNELFAAVQPQTCYHLAAEFGRRNGQDYAEQLWKSNCLGTHNVIEACVEHHTRLIFASSSEAYGRLADQGTLHESLLDNKLPQFDNEYALTKFTNEQQIRLARGLQATILRFFNVYGPGEYYSPYRSVVCLFIYRALKGLPVTVYTDTRRSSLYIDDWAQAVANAAETRTEPGQAYNIASTHELTMGSLWEIIEGEVGNGGKVTRIQTETGNVVAKTADISKAVAAFGLKESVSLTEGIKRTVDWMRKIYGNNGCT